MLPNGHEHALDWDPALARIGPSVIAGVRQQSDRGFVLALGSRARHKNMQLLLAAAPEFAAMDLEVIVAGGGAGIFASETLPSAPNVKVVGHVTDHDLAYLMDRALCLVFPSWTEGFGLPIVEAMARGCPVVSSDRASMPEVCGDAALMAPPDDPAAWVHHLRALAQSPDLRQDLIGRGRERVRLFSWAETAAGYIELMREPRTRSLFKSAGDRTLPNIAVVIATLGRPDIVTATLNYLLETQTLKPAAVIVSCALCEDAGNAAKLPTVKVVTGPPGLAAQRNAALAALPAGIDVVVFFDDDFVPDADWLMAAAQTFRDDPQVVAFTGQVLADGIKGPGMSFNEAVRIVEANNRSADWGRIEPFSPYGCNMAFRLSAIGELRFDERLVLYGWLEDRDFGAALAKRGGRLIKCATACGVHMGVKSGRVAGDRLGYSQVVNPIYMLRKGTMTAGQVAGQLFRNISSNVAGAVRPEPFIDRRGRLRGNLRGLADATPGPPGTGARSYATALPFKDVCRVSEQIANSRLRSLSTADGYAGTSRAHSCASHRLLEPWYRATGELSRSPGITIMLSTKTILGASWLVSAKLGGRAIDVVTVLVLARTLTPADFGLTALAMTLIAVADTVLEIPLMQALIRLKSVTKSHLDTAFTLGILRGVLLSVVVLAAAWPFPLFFMTAVLSL